MTVRFHLPFVSFDNFFVQSPQVWGLGESKELNATSLLAYTLHTAANGIRHPEVNDVIKNDRAFLGCILHWIATQLSSYLEISFHQALPP